VVLRVVLAVDPLLEEPAERLDPTGLEDALQILGDRGAAGELLLVGVEAH
jgi:hypothetical protein